MKFKDHDGNNFFNSGTYYLMRSYTQNLYQLLDIFFYINIQGCMAVKYRLRDLINEILFICFNFFIKKLIIIKKQDKLHGLYGLGSRCVTIKKTKN